MEPQENKKLALQKSINAHEQAAAALTDMISERDPGRYAAMLARIEENLAALQREASSTEPEDTV